MFKLNEDKLRAAFADQDSERWIAPFDPMKVDADELHRLIDDALEQGMIEREDQRAMIAIYPLSISEPEALLSVYPPDGPMLLGGSVEFAVGAENGDTTEGSVEVLRTLVDDANALYGESVSAKGREHVVVKTAPLLCPECCSEDVGETEGDAEIGRPEAELCCGNCPAEFDRNSALVRLGEMETADDPRPEPTHWQRNGQSG